MPCATALPRTRSTADNLRQPRRRSHSTLNIAHTQSRCTERRDPAAAHMYATRSLAASETAMRAGGAGNRANAQRLWLLRRPAAGRSDCGGTAVVATAAAAAAAAATTVAAAGCCCNNCFCHRRRRCCCCAPAAVRPRLLRLLRLLVLVLVPLPSPPPPPLLLLRLSARAPAQASETGVRVSSASSSQNCQGSAPHPCRRRCDAGA